MNPSTCPECGLTLPGGVTVGGCPVCLLGLGVASEPETPEAPARGMEEEAGQMIGRYRLLERIGEGGFGVVWRAEQLEPVRRPVALKVLKPGMDSREVIGRFEAERQALALMDHPGIARVFDAGSTPAGRPFFVMELVSGVPITEFCDTHRLGLRARLQLFVSVCHAIQHAHQKGVIHRDLKPGNILVAEQDGRAGPKVIDFGIAKATEQALTDRTLFTRLHQFVGTPTYMSPEQTGFDGLDVDTRSDIYSLGVLLYELLTGQVPFDLARLNQAGLEAVFRVIREQQPVRPSTRLGALPPDRLAQVATRRHETAEHLPQRLRGDLDWVVLKALEKDRARRYETANGLARDLDRFLNHEPVSAAPPSVAYQFSRFARRHRFTLAMVGAMVAALVVGTILSTSQAVRATRAATAEATLRRMLETNDYRLQNVAYAADLSLAAQTHETGDDELVREILQQQQPRDGGPDVRGWEWRHLSHRATGDPSTRLGDNTNALNGVAFLAEGTRVLACGSGGRLWEWEFPSGKLLRQWDTGNQQWWCVSVHPSDASAVAVSHHDDLAVRLDLDSGAWRLVPLDSENNGYRVRAAPDGSAYAHTSGGWGFTATNGVTVIRDPAFSNAQALPESGQRAAFSRDGRLLATGTWLDRIKLWQWPSLLPVGELGPVGGIASLDFSPDGRWLVSGGANGELCVWDVAGRSLHQRRRVHDGQTVGSAEFSPDGRMILTAAGDQRLVLWQADMLEPVRVLRGYADLPVQASWSPDGRSLVSTSQRYGLRIWPVGAASSATLTDCCPKVPAIFSPDSRSVAVGLGLCRGISVRSVADGRELARLESGNAVRCLQFDGQTMLVGCDGLCLTRYSVPAFTKLSESVLEVPATNANYGFPTVVSADGRWLARAFRSGEIGVWDCATGRLLRRFMAHEESVRSLELSHDGEWLLSAGERPTVNLWKTGSFELVNTFHTGGRDGCGPAFSPDARRVAVGATGSGFAVLDRETGRKLGQFPASAQGRSCFSPDGQTLITTGDTRISFWNLAANRRAGSVNLGSTVGDFLNLSPDGETLVTVTQDGRLHLLRAPAVVALTP